MSRIVPKENNSGGQTIAPVSAHDADPGWEGIEQDLLPAPDREAIKHLLQQKRESAENEKTKRGAKRKVPETSPLPEPVQKTKDRTGFRLLLEVVIVM